GQVPVPREQLRCYLGEELGEGRAARPGVGRGQPVPAVVAHWPPFCTKPRTKLSALVSSTSSISSSNASTSASWARAEPPVGAGAGASSSGGSDGRRCSNWRATVPPCALGEVSVRTILRRCRRRYARRRSHGAWW